DKPIAGQASYNVTPYAAGAYFEKIECFCFTEQVLAPGERVQMPVSFYVDPEIVDDPDGKFVHTITLSYTFYEIDLPEGYAALDDAATTDLN
ncbi:cytochrome c oxidase assembly protein, partial [Sulfitobacter sp. HI0023]|uniref:cytochrome c oxidase assembly protein n=2 Tax=Sulfitobacter TaxID=60136 RepID=UPI000AE5582B